MTTIKRAILTIWMLLSVASHADSRHEMAATLDGFHQAAALADADSYLAAVTDSVVYIGAGGAERWQGQDFHNFVQTRFAAGHAWNYKPVERHITLAADGQVAWFDEKLEHDSASFFRGSGVLVKSGREWKIAQYNLSLPVAYTAVSGAAVGGAVPGAAVAPAPAVDAPGVIESAAKAPAPVAAPPAADEQGEAVTKPAGHCKRKRFKTNRRADC